MRTLQSGLSGDDPLAMIRLPQRSLSSQSLGKYWQLSQNNQKTEHIATKTNNTQKGALINNNTIKHAKIYDIRPGNGAGQFLQPQSLHGADHSEPFMVYMLQIMGIETVND